MLKHLTAYFVSDSNFVNEYWITVKYSGIVVLFSIIVKYHPSLPFVCYRCSSTILKFLQDFLKISFFSFTFRYIFRIAFTPNKVSYFSIFPKFIVSQKEKRGFIWPKTLDFLFHQHSNLYSEKIIICWK